MQLPSWIAKHECAEPDDTDDDEKTTVDQHIAERLDLWRACLAAHREAGFEVNFEQSIMLTEFVAAGLEYLPE